MRRLDVCCRFFLSVSEHLQGREQVLCINGAPWHLGHGVTHTWLGQLNPSSQKEHSVSLSENLVPGADMHLFSFADAPTLCCELLFPPKALSAQAGRVVGVNA